MIVTLCDDSQYTKIPFGTKFYHRKWIVTLNGVAVTDIDCIDCLLNPFFSPPFDRFIPTLPRWIWPGRPSPFCAGMFCHTFPIATHFPPSLIHPPGNRLTAKSLYGGPFFKFVSWSHLGHTGSDQSQLPKLRELTTQRQYHATVESCLCWHLHILPLILNNRPLGRLLSVIGFFH